MEQMVADCSVSKRGCTARCVARQMYDMNAFHFETLVLKVDSCEMNLTVIVARAPSQMQAVKMSKLLHDEDTHTFKPPRRTLTHEATLPLEDIQYALSGRKSKMATGPSGVSIHCSAANRQQQQRNTDTQHQRAAVDMRGGPNRRVIGRT